MNLRRTVIMLLLAAWLAPAISCSAQPAAAPPATDQASAPTPATQPAPEPQTIVRRTVTGDGTVVAELSNGMTVIVRAMRQAPVVCVRAYVRTGGMYEGKWLGCGISHLLEHLVAKGATHDMGEGGTDQSAQQETGRVEEIGGQSNAFTSMSMTCYYISATAGRTDECIDLVADWLARPEIPEADFNREHGVVQRELEMRKDDPDRQLFYAHMANFFAGHPAAVPVIGYARPLSELTYQDVLDYHAKMYVPQHMVFAVVGDVDVEAVLARVQQAMAGFDHGRTPELTLPEVPQVAETRRVVQASTAVTETVQEIAFRTIPLLHEDLYALDVLSYILTQGPASRLERTIRREAKLVSSISSSSWTPDWGAGMFTVSFRATPENADAAEQAVIDQLRDVMENGVSDEELARAKRQKVADLVYSQQTAESVAATLATDFLSAHDVNFSRTYTRRIQDVSAADVQRMAAKYFDFDRMVITRLTPAEAESSAEQAVESAGAQAAEPQLITLSNGLRVALLPSDAVGLVSMAFVGRGGLLLEDDATNGLGAAMTALSVKGAGDRSAEQIAAFFDQAGGGIGGNCGSNSFYWQATVLDDSFEEALDILADVIIRPTFDPAELDILRPALLTRIRQQDEGWWGQLKKFFRKSFYTDSPYRLLPSGRLEVVEPVTAEQLAEYHRENLRAGSSVLAICGNFDAAATAERLETLFADMPTGEVTIPQVAPRTVPPGGETATLKTDTEVAAITVAAPGMTVGDLADRMPIDVLDTLISGWNLPSGWLHKELRGKQLVYVVHAYNWTGLAPGAFMVYAACQPEKADEVVSIIRKNLDRAAEFEPTQKEIDRAVNTILTAELLDNQEMSSLAMSAALDELYGLGYDFRRRMEKLYRAVTPADVRRVAQKYLGHGYVVTVTSPLAEQDQKSEQ